MHEHDTDLIMALADGMLDPERAAVAEADVASCPMCAEDLALQRTAVAFLSTAPPATMNDLERTRIRRSVRDELGLAPATAAKPAAGAARRYRLFAALAGAAAVLVAFVALAPGTNLLDIGGGDDDADTVAFAPETTIAGDGDAVPEAATNDLRSLQGDTDVAAGAEAPTTTTAPVTTPAPDTTSPTTAPSADGSLGYSIWSATERETLPDLSDLAAALIEQKSLETVIGPQVLVEDDRVGAATSDPRCLAAVAGIAPASDAAYVIGLSGINDVEVLIVAYVTGDFDAVTVVAQDIETCKVLARSD